MAGQAEEAQGVLDTLDPKIAADPAVQSAAAALALAAEAPPEGELAQLRAAALAAPDNMETQFDYANAAFAAGDRDTAANVLLAMITANPSWNESAARAKLLQIFEAIGLEDPWVSAARRRLSIVRFG